MCKTVWLTSLLLLATSGSAVALNDPMRPSYQKETATAQTQTQLDRSLHLSSILIRPTAKYAVLNGIRVKERDSIGETKILQIHANYVLVRKNGTDTKLYLSFPISHRSDKGAKF